MTSFDSPGNAMTRPEKIRLIIILGMLTALGPFTIDMYLPAFPEIRDSMGVSDVAIQLTLTATIIGFASGQLFMGPLSDKVGRILPLKITTTLHIVASVGAALSTDVTMLLVFRLLQGIGAAGSGVVAMAIIRDLFHGNQLVKILSYSALVTGLAPIIAPLLGSVIVAVAPWPVVFWFLSIYGAVMAVAVWTLIAETRPRVARAVGDVTAWQRYKAVLSDRIYVGVVLLGGFNFGALFVYLSSASFLFRDGFGFSEIGFGLFFAINSLAVMIGVQTSSRLIRRIGVARVLIMSTSLMLVMSGLIVVLDRAEMGLWGVVLPLWFYILGAGATFPCVQVLALINNGAQAGTAASLMGAITFGMSGIVSPIVGAIGISVAAMGSVMFLCIVAAAACLWLIIRPWTVPALEG